MSSRFPARLKIPLPIRVVGCLLFGLSLGLLFPDNRIVKLLYVSGTYFPRTVVTFATFLIFNLLASAMAKLMLFHKEKAGKMFGLILGIYVTMGAVSLVWVTGWLALLSRLPFSLPGVAIPGPAAWAVQIGRTFTRMLSQQPLLQALIGAMFIGWVTGRVLRLNRIAYGFIAVGDCILWVFRKLLWYYPIMIGCLAIGIPMKFGTRGIALYGQGVLWDMIIICAWCGCIILFCKLVTRRTWSQILSYYGTVWPTGFGTGGSYDTLAVNIISAESDLGLRRDVAEVSIVFGTVLNKNCATMSCLIVTIIVAKLLNVPVSMMEVIMMLPPVMILGLESPGIPGGAGYFMSPIIAALLHVPDQAAWITTFVACYSGLIPMFSTAGNTTDDGVVGALLQDRFGHLLVHGGVSKATEAVARVS
jgi:Na+/H+-dicarboxylate symporter